VLEKFEGIPQEFIEAVAEQEQRIEMLETMYKGAEIEIEKLEQELERKNKLLENAELTAIQLNEELERYKVFVKQYDKEWKAHNDYLRYCKQRGIKQFVEE